MPTRFNVFTGTFDIVDTSAGSGDVEGPAIATDNAVARYNGTGGTSIQNSGVIIDDSNFVTGVASLTLASGASITEFSTDGTLGGNSDTAVPTEQAVKTYVDGASGGNVSNTGTPLDGQISIWTNATTVEGDAALTFDTISDSLVIAASGNLKFGAVTILADSAGTTTLSNIDAIDATTETTLESAIDSLTNLVAVGALDAGSITSGFGSIDIGSSTFDTTGAVSTGTLTATTYAGSGDMTIYEAVNDGNPEIRLGANDSEELHIQTVYNGASQNLDYILFQTDTVSAAANRGLYRFNVDGTDILDIDDGGLELTGSITVSGTVDGRDVATDGSKLDGIEALADVTDATNVAAAGAVMDGDFSTNGVMVRTGAGTYVNRDIAGTTNQIDFANGDGVSGNPTASISATYVGQTSITTLGTIATGTWQGTTIAVDQGGTGQTSYTNGQLLIGNTTGNTLDKATLTGGTNLTVVNGGGSITLNVDDSFLLNTGDTGTGVYDFGGATSFEIPNSATPTVDADGEIAVDTTVTDWSHGILKYYGGEEMGVVAMPIAQFTSPTDNHVVTYNATNDEFELQAGGSGGGFQAELNFPMASLRVNTSLNFPEPVYMDLGTVEDYVRAFDGTQSEYVIGTFGCPSDLDTSGTVTFEIYGKRASGTSAANVVFAFEHRAVADSEAADGSYTSESSGALAVDTTDGDLDRLTWTETVTNLGWAANDLIIFRVQREGGNASDTLNSVDYYGWHFRILIPRA